MQSIIDAIEQWLKDFLIGAITGNLSNMFSDVNNKVATIATEVGKTPESWNSDVFSIILTLSRNVVVPIVLHLVPAVYAVWELPLILMTNISPTAFFSAWMMLHRRESCVTLRFLMAVASPSQ